MYRVGTGFDVHRLVPGRALVLGGVSIEYHLGLDGHSDADVLIHALMDALLGAAGLRDIGYYFPPGDARYLNISSIDLLAMVRDRLEGNRWCLVNADTTVIAEEPRLANHLEQMRGNMARVLDVTSDRVTVKATTTEKLGFCGRGEGIAAQAVVLLEKNSQPSCLPEA